MRYMKKIQANKAGEESNFGLIVPQTNRGTISTGKAPKRSISRILCPDRNRVAIISLGQSSPTGSCGLPASVATSRRCASLRGESHSLLGLAPAGGCLAGHIAAPPVSSYLTFSPSPLARQSVSVVLLRASPRPDVIRQPARWSSDFPQTDQVRPRSPDALWHCNLSTAPGTGQWRARFPPRRG